MTAIWATAMADGLTRLLASGLMRLGGLKQAIADSGNQALVCIIYPTLYQIF